MPLRWPLCEFCQPIDHSRTALGPGRLGLLLFNVALSAHGAYEGPPKLSRYTTPYDIRFAAFISFTFGFVFALAALRFAELRRRVLTWICIIAYMVVTPGWVEKMTRYLH